MKLENYALGSWITGDGNGKMLYDAVTGQEVAISSSKGLDFEAMFKYAHQKGNVALRRMTFHERGRMLRALALYLMTKKELFYELSYRTGATRTDSWIDIEGGIGNLFAYASLRKNFPNLPYCPENEAVSSSKGGTFIGHHILTPKEGVALHINAFNFPIWGMLEKIAVNFLAGVPAIVKPATTSSFLTESVVREIIGSKILPEGALQFIAGSADGILNHVSSQDVVTFTGSAGIGQMLKSHPRIISESVPFNMEADSLNSAILGEDAVPGTGAFDLFIKEVSKEMSTKCGQKCTAIRRIIVPENLIEAVQKELSAALSKLKIGNPRAEGVRMGAMAAKEQVAEVREKVAQLSVDTPIVFGSLDTINLIDADAEKGAFLSPILMLNNKPFELTNTHNIEAFGPVSTVMPYKDLGEAIALSKLGKGSLCCSITTNNDAIATEFVLGAASHHGRILILNESCAKESTGHGSPLPLLVHGGPGRAGGGEEMGGMRGVKHYMQRTAIQGSPTTITAITQTYQTGSEQIEDVVHPFQKHFEDLKIGETYNTHKHTVTEADITNFANVSGDNFYAHTDATSLEGTAFTGRVAHGYFILSKAAGLFVHPKKGPVLLNYGLESCRFTKPVYPNTTIDVKLIVKEKIVQEHR